MTINRSRFVSGTARRRPRRRRRETEPDNPGRLNEVLVTVADSVATLEELQSEQKAALGESLERLEKQLARVGREQYKVNALLEAQHKTADSMLEQLREESAHRERELGRLREQAAQAREEGRLDTIKAVLPALDGLREALASGERLLQRAEERAKAPRRTTFWQRLVGAHRQASIPEALSPEAMTAWLKGIAFVHDRLMQALAAEDVVPIDTVGHPFDPHRHVAVESVPAAEGAGPATVVREHRRGYLHGDTILRYAEVVVARGSREAPQ